MKQGIHLPIPIRGILSKVGKDISDARKRRRITMELMSERANISRATLSKIEKGYPNCSMGAYAAVLFVLGMEKRLNTLIDATYDLTGRQLEEEKLPKRIRLSKK